MFFLPSKKYNLTIVEKHNTPHTRPNLIFSHSSLFVMKIQLQATDFKPQDELVDFVNEKLGKLDRYADNILEARVTLKLDKSDVRENKVCEVKLAVPGNDLFASRHGKSFEEATADVVEALRKQIEARKEK